MHSRSARWFPSLARECNQTASPWIDSFGYTAGGWRVDRHPRTLVDVNNDSLPDLVGFASSGVYLALNKGTGFQAASRWIA